MTVAAIWSRPPRVVRALVAGLGLMVISAIVVHLSGGAIEAHFHFFAMVPIAALYESWYPFGVAVGFVLVHHGVIGTINSDAVYNHRAAQEHPWTWAAIHAALFAAACVGALINWKLHEGARGVAVHLSHQAHHDALTGLPNRTLLHKRTTEALAAAAGLDQQPTMLLLDLDGFKQINDTLGHLHGDLLLVEVAQRLLSSVRPEDMVGRLGGDEFAVLLTRCPA
ncbi:MAG: GGDEF domain-containing protein, partial [Sporichthyaceae bacterium]|nr:GGDEF domain-containing protein [Sporichthyaceae bacterium]